MSASSHRCMGLVVGLLGVAASTLTSARAEESGPLCAAVHAGPRADAGTAVTPALPPPPPTVRVEGSPAARASDRVVRASLPPFESRPPPEPRPLVCVDAAVATVAPPPVPPCGACRRLTSSPDTAAYLRATPAELYYYRTWNSPWVISARLSAWAPRSSGTFTEGIDSISTSASSDPLELDFSGFQGQLEIRRGPWSLRGEKTYAGVSGTAFEIGGVPAVRAGAEADMDQVMLGYRCAPVPLGFRVRDRCAILSAELSVGARFYDVDVWGEAAGLTVRLGTSEVDPVVGLRFEVPLTRRWTITASGDVGGFGYGTDFSSMLVGEVEYWFDQHWSVQVGWRHLYVEKDVGTDVLHLDWHSTLTGPTLSVKYTF